MLVGLLAACGPTEPEDIGLAGELSPADAHAAVLTVTGAATELRCATEGGADIHRVPIDEESGPIVVRGLLADTTYRCTATGEAARSAPVVLTTPPLPADLPVPEVTVAADAAEVGLHLVNVARLADPELAAGVFFTDEYLVVYDSEGRPRWHHAGDGGGDIDATWLPDGRVLYGGFGADASTAPTIRTLDGEVAWQAADTLSSTWQVPASWHHDVGVSADGASLWVLAQEQKPTADDPEVDWEGFVVERIDLATGEVTWSWSSIEDGVTAGALPEGDRYNTGPYHANAVWDVVEGGQEKLYVSLRNLNQVVRIDVDTRAVDLRVGLGGDLALLDADGTPAEDAAWFFGQHDAKRVGDHLVVYDNGLGRNAYGAGAYSRALVLRLDEAAGTATIETAWRGDAEWSAPAWGGLDRREDGSLDLAIGNFWWADRGSPERSALALLAPDDNGGAALRWRLDFPDEEIALYRSDRVDPCFFGLVELCP